VRTIELDDTEALLLAVALREYLQGDAKTGYGADVSRLRDHATTKSVLESLVARVDPQG
jgi:hypothetical protein